MLVNSSIHLRKKEDKYYAATSENNKRERIPIYFMKPKYFDKKTWQEHYKKQNYRTILLINSDNNPKHNFNNKNQKHEKNNTSIPNEVNFNNSIWCNTKLINAIQYIQKRGE